jgi:hypothetical protein
MALQLVGVGTTARLICRSTHLLQQSMHMALCYRPSADFNSCNDIAALKISHAQGREELCMGIEL